ncbi:MAG: penicillin-binding transpeptidase domain-containing protein [Verrucomicrobiota bacterium]|nr:penicillin-binding transpeptidase domain-containing protein [Limisphaera sp.]MDW8381001.1 penicillin-binding transpeptidase domain-containing protein [Verrucomicrobiota bacterium]
MMSLLDPAEHDNRAVNGLAVLVLAGLVVLLVGLWWIQVASRHTYQGQLEIQAVRTVRVPAARGRILDRTGVVLADTQPSFNLGLYLEELSREFRQEYGRIRPVEVVHRASLWTFGRGSAQVVTQAVRLSRSQLEELQWTARLRVVSNAVRQLSEVLGNPIAFDAERFRRHYLSQLALPYPVLVNLKVEQAARVAEAPALPQGADIDVLPLRVYPFQATAGHLLGYLIRDDRSAEGEEADYSYRLPDYRGVVGIEAAYDSFLRGRAGVKSVWVNHLGYKQAEQIWSPAEPGLDVVLTLDWRIQLAAEQALLRVGANVRGAVVALDVNTGDVLALVSVPGLNPNHFVTGFPAGEYDRLRDPLLRAQVNRATQEQYVPGSILKPLVALAALDRGLNPSAPYMVQSDPARPDRGCIYVGRRKIRDTAPPGEYNLRRALLRSSNSYFVHHGLQPGVVERLAELGVRLGLGQKIGLPTRQEAAGVFPSPAQVRSASWRDGDTANLCMGQGPVAVTPLQMALVYAALANGGRLLQPRLVDRLEAPFPRTSSSVQQFPAGLVRRTVALPMNHLRILHEAMLADTEDPEGTGREAALPGFRVCGKTGTAQVMDAQGRLRGYTTWFVGFAPYESPSFVVAVMVEDGGSGGATCAPVAREVFRALQEYGQRNATGWAKRG